ncbi:hypothetical protein [Amycolatopsis kentuckyensis]|uniref:hypothetical protein n=1 Tax=Amycolatopsis kentuckyensis TaxID=218823 RepID=UPI003562156A
MSAHPPPATASAAGRDEPRRRSWEHLEVDRLVRALNELDTTARRAEFLSALTDSPHRGRPPARPAPANPAVHSGKLVLPQHELVVDNPVDLARLLARCMAGAGLTAGQVAAKSGIPRSQTYNLIDPKRNSLPRKESQVEAFLTACRLHGEQIGFVLARWRRLDADRGRFKATITAPAPKVPDRSAPAPVSAPEPPPDRREPFGASRRGLAGSVAVVLLAGIALAVDPAAIWSVVVTAMATAIVAGKVLRLKERLSFALRGWVMQAVSSGGDRSHRR